MKYRIRNAHVDEIIEGETFEEIIQKLCEDHPERATDSFTWKKVED